MNLWPRVARCSGLWWLGKKLQVYNAGAAVSDGCPDAIGTGVTTTDYNYLFALGGNVITVLEIAIQ